MYGAALVGLDLTIFEPSSTYDEKMDGGTHETTLFCTSAHLYASLPPPSHLISSNLLTSSCPFKDFILKRTASAKTAKTYY